MDESTAQIAHLYRRAGFGARPEELDAAAARGYQATLAGLLEASAPDPAGDAVALPTMTSTYRLFRNADAATRMATAHQLRQEAIALGSWWLQRMVATSNPLTEKMTLLWHGQFATSIQKVRFARLMYGQNQIFRTQGMGRFDTLTQAVAKDPAMLIWLDANTDKQSHPNENFARELMERFTMGVGNYSETDVREAARCFTGWVFNPVTGAYGLQPLQHDDGTKTVLGHTGNLSGEDVVDIVTHSPASARFVVASLWSHLAYPVTTTDKVVAELAPAYAADLDVSALVAAIFNHPGFVSPEARTGLVKQPVEYVVGALRALGLGADSPALLAALDQLGQVPFAPPSVGGWPQNDYWLSTASALTRLRLADRLVAGADISTVADAPRTDRVDAAARLLSVERWSPSTAGALQAVSGSPPELVALALVSPEYVSN